MEATNQRTTPRSAQDNINTIVRIEETSLKERTLADKISDAIANFVGSIMFVVIHVIWFGVWVALNAGILRFDPYPFQLLCMLVSLEGVLLSTFQAARPSASLDVCSEGHTTKTWPSSSAA